MYQKCSGQVIVAGMGDILGIKFEAIEFVFDIYEIDDREERRILFEKIQTIDIIRLKNSKTAKGNVTSHKTKRGK